MATSDDTRLVRVRAAEFLGLIGEEDPTKVLLKELENCESGLEACLVLNSVVLLQDGEASYQFPLEAFKFKPAVASDGYVQRRLQYLTGDLSRN